MVLGLQRHRSKIRLSVNLGDLIPRWSNDLYKSNPHRVRNLFSKGQSPAIDSIFLWTNYMTPISYA